MACEWQDHFAALNKAFGTSTSDDLRTLGQESVADDLQAAVAACIQQSYESCLVSGKDQHFMVRSPTLLRHVIIV